MKSAIPTTILCFGLLSCLLAAEAEAQSIDRLNGDLMSALEDPSMDLVVANSSLTSEPEAGSIDDGAECGSQYDTCCECCNDPCGSDFWTRPYLTGDMWGARSSLAEHGVLVDLQTTQFYQGVSSGGSEQNFQYGGKNDYMFTFLGGKLGLHEGLTVIMHAETRFGEDVNVDAGVLAFPNTNMLYPFPEENITSISGLIAIQALNEKVSLRGCLQTTDLLV